MSILIFLAVLFVLVLVHEWGHYITAKLTGMRVDEFGIGFPPKLFGIKKGETEYTFNALPIGGFVKIYGEDGVDDPSQRPDGDKGDANEAKNGAPNSGAFTSKSKWAQALVLVAGVSMNVLFAWFLFTGAFMWGVDEGIEEGARTPDSRLVVTGVIPGGPAGEASLPSGVTITGVTEGARVLTELTPSAFSKFVSESGGNPVQVLYTKDDELFAVSVAPEAGIIDAEPERKAIGVALALVDRVEYGFFAALYEGFIKTVESTKLIAVGIFDLIHDALFGRADLSQVAGPVGIVGLVGEASAYGLSALLMFTAFISLNLAVINLLPFPALDGGRLLFVGIEAVTRRAIPARVSQIMNAAGFFILIGLMLVVTWSDISKLI